MPPSAAKIQNLICSRFDREIGHAPIYLIRLWSGMTHHGKFYHVVVSCCVRAFHMAVDLKVPLPGLRLSPSDPLRWVDARWLACPIQTGVYAGWGERESGVKEGRPWLAAPGWLGWVGQTWLAGKVLGALRLWVVALTGTGCWYSALALASLARSALNTTYTHSPHPHHSHSPLHQNGLHRPPRRSPRLRHRYRRQGAFPTQCARTCDFARALRKRKSESETSERV